MRQEKEILHLTEELGAEVSSGLLTNEEAMEMLTYGFVVE